MKFTRSGKIRCSQCLKIATHRLRGFDRLSGYLAAFYVYHCPNHVTRLDEPISDNNPRGLMK